MSDYTDEVRISSGIWEVDRLGGGECPEHLRGKPIGIRLTGADQILQGDDYLTRDEALELRDYINTHLGDQK